MEQSRTDIVEELKKHVGESDVLTSGPEYDAARRVWNAAVEYRPRVIVQCRSADAVQYAVRAAVARGYSLSVRAGGHDWAGRAMRGELVIDLTPMSTVTIKGEHAFVGGGATSIEVAEAAGRAGFAVVTGNLGSVGMSGLTLGGGYGPLTGRFGLASDNLVGAEVVLATGELVWADESQNADLLWALRGGGGNFGVVTRMQIKLHPMPDLSAGLIAFPWAEAESVAEKLGSLQMEAPEGLTLSTALCPDESGKLSLMILYAWCGDQQDDDEMLDRVKGLGKTDVAQVGRMSYVQMLRNADAFGVPGVSALYRTVTLGSLAAPAITVILSALEKRSSPLSYVVFHPFHGAAERVSLAATAFGLRRGHFVVGIYAFWKGGDETPHRAWADDLERALTPFAFPSAYPNYFGPDRPNQAEVAYGTNAARLLELKRRFDPGKIFSATLLPSDWFSSAT